MDDARTPETLDRASLARETNGHIRLLARRLRDVRPIGFLCECGCMEITLATLEEYEEHGGARIDGHEPE
ncbi:MAG TPA: hypothetical protein VFM43_04435 [Gaiellaceae bacterium]|nr:hypothetical protein [Gaiellaceae bacterium]